MHLAPFSRRKAQKSFLFQLVYGRVYRLLAGKGVITDIALAAAISERRDGIENVKYAVGYAVLDTEVMVELRKGFVQAVDLILFWQGPWRHGVFLLLIQQV